MANPFKIMGLTKSFLYKTHYILSVLVPLPLTSSLQHFCTKSPSLSNPSSLTSDTKALCTSSTINHLIEWIGLSKEAAIAASSIFPTMKTPGNHIAVINFLRNSGFHDTHIHKIVIRNPRILSMDVENIIKPKLKLFEDLGLSGSELGAVIAANRSLLCASHDRRLQPTILLLKNYLENKEDVLRAIKRCGGRILCYDPEKILLPNIKFMQELGIVGPELVKFLSRYPKLFNRHPKRTEELAERVRELGFPYSNMFCYAMLALSSISKETLQSKVEFFKSYGWSEDDVFSAFRRNPHLLSLSTKKLRKGMDYFTKEMKFDKPFLIARPKLFFFSLEGRVIPRLKVMEALRSKNLLEKDVDFHGVCSKLEKKFLEQYVYYYKDEAENLLRIYNGCKENPLIGV